jgi:Kdo2-lipid IVA lauroyltransferase/acyltransferase
VIRALRHAVEYGLIRFVLLLDRVLGDRLAGRLAAGLGRIAYRPLRIRATTVEAHLRQAFPDRDERWVRRTAAASYAHLGRESLAMLRLSRQGRDLVIAATEMPPILDELRAAVEAGTGAIVVTGHVGNWEIAAAGIAARGIPVDAVVRSQKNPRVDRLITDTRERLGLRVVKRGDATRAALRGLAESRVIGLAADQDARAAGVFVPFLGRQASTYRGPALLALRTGAPLYVGLSVRRPDGRYEARIQRIDRPAGGPFDDRVRAMTEAWTRALEAVVRQWPEQYFWHHRRWKTEPPGDRNGSPGSEVSSGAREALRTTDAT